MTALEFLQLGLKKGDLVKVTLDGGLSAECVFTGLKTNRAVNINDPDEQLWPEFRLPNKRGGAGHELAFPTVRFTWIKTISVIRLKDRAPLSDIMSRFGSLQETRKKLLSDASAAILAAFNERGINDVNLEECGINKSIYVDADKILEHICVEKKELRLCYYKKNLSPETRGYLLLAAVETIYVKTVVFWLRGIIMMVDKHALTVNKDGYVIQREPENP